MSAALKLIGQVFKDEHDFEHEDIEVLKIRWPSIHFHNIPVAWIFPIDEMLCKMRYNNPVYEVRQEFGQFIVLFRHTSDKYKSIIESTERDILSLDPDMKYLYELSFDMGSKCKHS